MGEPEDHVLVISLGVERIGASILKKAVAIEGT